MAFANKFGNLFKQAISSNPSVYQTIRSMSSNKLFVGGLSYATDDSSLREAFAKYGEVSEARVIIDRETGRSRGFGFVTFISSEEASAAISGMDGKELYGRMIRVNPATERRGGFGGGGGGFGSGAYGAGGGGFGGDNYDSGSGGGYGSSGAGGYGGSRYGGSGNVAGGASGSDNYASGATGNSFGSGDPFGGNLGNAGGGDHAGSEDSLPDDNFKDDGDHAGSEDSLPDDNFKDDGELDDYASKRG